jgi:hypothetical protein
MNLWDFLTEQGVPTRLIITDIKGIDRRKALALCREQGKEAGFNASSQDSRGESRPQVAELSVNSVVA